jgi:amino acid adenylation domain-containing protein
MPPSSPNDESQQQSAAGALMPALSSGFREFALEETEQAIHVRFERMVAVHGARLAVKTREETLTYDRLNREANRVAWTLLDALGDGEDPVAVLLDRDAWLPIAFLGAAKSGKIVVPLDVTFPVPRLAEILADARASVILAPARHAAMAEALAAGPTRVIGLETLGRESPESDPSRALSADRLACIIYTSGSTGAPKGVSQNHRNLLHQARYYTNGHRITPQDRVGVLASPSAIAAVWNTFAALLNGAALFPLGTADGLDGLVRWIRDEEITIVKGALPMVRHLAGARGTGVRFPSVRYIAFGGETVYRRDVEVYRRLFEPHCLVHTGLGTTETGALTCYVIDSQTEISGPAVPIGFPVDGKEVWLAREDGTEAEDDEVGEIMVRSRFLSPGYWRRPDLTRRVFRHEPAGKSERVYRTGDLARRRPDGCLIHAGRKDLQVKVRGERVNLAEVEGTLLSLGGVSETIVRAEQDAGGECRLLAYVVPGEGPPRTASELRRALASVLPSHMVPASYILLEALPRTGLGKVDLTALPAPSMRGPESGSTPAAPRTPVEHRLARILADVLGVPRLGIHDNFWELGGSSLLAAEVVSRAGGALGVRVPLSALVEAPTVAELADLLGRRRDGAQAPASSPMVIRRGGSRPPLFCIHHHLGTLFCFEQLARHLDPRQPVYGLQARGLDGISPPCRRVEEMAANYVQVLREAQPRGPYFLAGYCFGGLVAFEMAQQMVQAGDRVGLLAVLDIFPGPRRRSRGMPLNPIQRVLRRCLWRTNFEAANLAALTARERIDYVFARARAARSILGRGLRERLHGVQPEGAALRAVAEAHRAAMAEYIPRVYSGRVVLFRPRYRWGREFADPAFGWAGLAAGGLTVEVVPGGFLLELPFVRALAERFGACLTAAQASATEANRGGRAPGL